MINILKSLLRMITGGLYTQRKGFEMPISAVIAIVLGVLFVAAYWTAASGYFEIGVEQAQEIGEGVN